MLSTEDTRSIYMFLFNKLPTREVGRAVAGQEAPGGTPLGQQETASFDACI